jgi:hypothetical protein
MMGKSRVLRCECRAKGVSGQTRSWNLFFATAFFLLKEYYSFVARKRVSDYRRSHNSEKT